MMEFLNTSSYFFNPPYFLRACLEVYNLAPYIAGEWQDLCWALSLIGEGREMVTQLFLFEDIWYLFVLWLLVSLYAYFYVGSRRCFFLL